MSFIQVGHYNFTKASSLCLVQQILEPIGEINCRIVFKTDTPFYFSSTHPRNSYKNTFNKTRIKI